MKPSCVPQSQSKSCVYGHFRNGSTRQMRGASASIANAQTPSSLLHQENKREDCRRDKPSISFLERLLLLLPLRLAHWGPATPGQYLLLNRDYEKKSGLGTKMEKSSNQKILEMKFLQKWDSKYSALAQFCYLLPSTEKSKLGQCYRTRNVTADISFTIHVFIFVLTTIVSVF